MVIRLHALAKRLFQRTTRLSRSARLRVEQLEDRTTPTEVPVIGVS